MPTTKISTTSILSKLKIKSLNEMQLASIEAIDKIAIEESTLRNGKSPQHQQSHEARYQP